MSYATIATCAGDGALTRRVTAAVVQEGNDVSQATTEYLWSLSAASDIEAAYASALAAGNDDPGGDEAVITDGMILSYVQTNPPPPTTPLP